MFFSGAMATHPFPQALRAGQRLYGTLIVSTSPKWPEPVSQLGLDFVFIDTEHIAIDRAQLSWMCRTYRGLGLYPVVRILSPDPFLACAALDGGAGGIVAPYVESPDQVQALVGAVKRRPLKGRKLTSNLTGAALEPKLEQYLARTNRDQALIVNIESVPALEALDEILSVEGLDAALIGPHDLSCSLGIPEEYDNPKFEEAVLTIISKARKRGLGAGIHCIMGAAYLDRERAWMEAGANLVLHSADIIAAMQALKREIASLKQKSDDGQIKSTELNV